MRRKIQRLYILAAVAASTVPQTAMAEWGANPDPGIRTPWIYTPSSTLKGSPRHGLMVVLHGCAQTHNDLKGFGNLETAAEDNGLVLAVPSVGNRPSPACWDYNGATDKSHDAADIIALVQDLMSPGRSLNIDPDYVYVVGLSSGAALSLMLGCKAPEVFAGIGAIAGPSVGSNQNNALGPVPAGNVQNAINACNSLAGAKRSSFATQVANIGYGEMDKDGPNPGSPYSLGDTQHPGQYALVSVDWSKDNIRILKQIYGAGDLGAIVDIQGGKGAEQSATAGGQSPLALLAVKDVGHAWPAGSGKPNSADSGGVWIAQQGLSYPKYIAAWLVTHNRRAKLAPDIRITQSTGSGDSIKVEGTAQDKNPDGQITDVSVKLDGQFPQPDRKASGTNHWSATFSGLNTDACYTPVAAAKDSFGRSATATVAPVKLGNPPSKPPALTVDGSLDSRQCIEVSGAAKSECSTVQKVEAELGERGFEPADFDGQNYSYTTCGLPGGTYAIKVRATDADGQTTLAADGNVVIPTVNQVTAQFFEHVLANRIRMYSAPCSNTGYGACDADVPTIVSTHRSGAFPLYTVGDSNLWYLDPNKAQHTASQRFDINSATAQDLMKLPEIGRTRAQAVIKNRPYADLNELVTKHIIPAHVYNAIKEQLTASRP